MTGRYPVVQGERSRLHVQADKLRAGVPFYANAQQGAWNLFYVPSDAAELLFMGIRCEIVDRDGDHLVLQRIEEP